MPSLLTTLTAAGAPLAGAPVALQTRTVARRGETVVHTTVGEGVTDAEGHCLLAASFAAGAKGPVWVRALHAGGPGAAAVSAAVEVEPVAAPAISPAPAASAPSG